MQREINIDREIHIISDQQLGTNIQLLNDEKQMKSIKNFQEDNQNFAENQHNYYKPGMSSTSPNTYHYYRNEINQIQESNNISYNQTPQMLSLQSFKEQNQNMSFERLKNHTNRQNSHFKQQIPAIQLKGDEDSQSVHTNFRQVDSIKERDCGSSSHSNSFSRIRRDSQQGQSEVRTNSLNPQTKYALAKISKKNGDIFQSYHEDDEKQNRKDSKFLSVHAPSIYKPDDANDSLSVSKFQKSGYLSVRGNNSFQKEKSDQQESQNQGTKSYRDDISELQQTIFNRPRLGLNMLWKKRSLSIIQKVARFINIILLFSMKKRFKQLKKSDFELIGDYASSYEYYLYKDQFENQKTSLYQKVAFTLFEGLNKNFKSMREFCNLQVLKPYQTIKLLWDILMVGITTLNIVLVPLICFVDSIDDTSQWIQFIYLSSIAFIADIFITLNTAFFQSGVIQENRGQIIKRYIKQDLLLDIVTLLPYISGAAGLSKYLLLLIILKAYKLTQIRKHLVETIQPGEKFLIVIRIINVFLLIFFIAHLIATGFIWVAMQQYQTQDDYDSVVTWISKAGLLYKPWGQVYLNALYWAIISMITIGYGDITPQTVEEKAYTISICMISSAVFAYCINTISQIISDLKQKQKKLKARIKNLNQFLDTRGLDKHLQIKVRKFIEHIHISEEFEGSAMKDLEIIPKQIKQEVQIDIYGKILKKIQLFQFNFSEEAINNLALKVTESSFTAGEFLFRQGEQSEKMYILMQGKVELQIEMKSKDKEDLQSTIYVLEKGQIFGVEEFFGEHTRNFTAKAVDVSRVIEISQKNIIQSLSSTSQNDIEKFQMMKDKVKFSNSTRGLGVQCYYCLRYTHSYQDCPNFNVSNNKLVCLAKYNYSQNILVRNEYRRCGKKINSVALKPFLSNSVDYYLHYRQFQDNNKQTDGFTEDTVENVRPRNISNFSYHMNSQRNIFKNYISGNDSNNQTSIKLAAAPNPQPSLMLVEALDQQFQLQQQQQYQLSQQSENMLEDRPSISNIRPNYKNLRQKSREHSVNRIQKRNLTNIVEERSFMNETNITSNPSQFQSNLNAMSSNNQVLLRNSTGIRNLTWNGVQQNLYQHQFSNPKFDSTNDNQDQNQKSPSLLHYQLSPQLLPQNILSNNSLNSIPNPTSSINVNYNNNTTTNNSAMNNNYIPTVNSAFGTNIQNDLVAGKTSSNYISLNERRNSLATPKNNVYSNTNNNLSQGGNQQQRDQNGNPNQSLSQQFIQTQNSNQPTNSELNAFKNQLNNNELQIEIQSIRNIKASSNWEIESMKLFDKFRIYKQYFPYNNIDKVLVRVNGAYFLIQQKRERNKKKMSLKKLMKKNSIMIDGGLLNSSKKNTSKKFSLNNMDINSINIKQPNTPSKSKEKDRDSQKYLYTKDKSLSGGGQNMRPHKFSHQDSTTINNPI
ncbi:cyclic nucleotide-binding domain protein (macronuclear) [Tetrahymena thermophila SB210]|uniref:Cyclic nucleotide-binding domain protein n=1 Tax=Tetrahymena thermophila (strain SB210) TaxID=312017 RepID=I7M953_TETTS|nr:cyclic nucleotide-binding domain protein [Tetrahymena thermophila SB210]EAS00808.3 cyclic nucleotide-binding domain protein [Tetrahymena thermophila SB210]|eukprot:XP_001021053.3 cyclic nucleotide-binding domain protein [Tetrahymena thermophila SB210]